MRRSAFTTELDPELPSGDAIDERRQAERRQLFEEQADAGETVLEFTPVMEEFGPADDPVPLVPPRERGDIDELFARIRESRADAVLVFLMPPSLEVLEERLRGRSTDSEEVIVTVTNSGFQTLTAGTEIDLDLELNGGFVASETMTLSSDTAE